MAEYKRVEVDGQAVLFKGDPRTKVTDTDSWFTNILEWKVPKIVKRPYLYGSDAGFCPRRNCLLEHNTFVDSLVNSAGSGYMAIGVAFENLLAESLQNTGKLVVQDSRLIEIDEVKVSGKIDMFIFDQEDELAIVECKTTGDLPIEPKPTHLAQVLTYSAISGIDKAYLIYMSRNLNPKNSIPLKVFKIDTSEEVIINTLTTILLSRYSTDERLLLPIPKTFRKHTECHYCEFRDYYCYLRSRTVNKNKEDESVVIEGDKDNRYSNLLNTLNLTDISTASYIELDNRCRTEATDIYIHRKDNRLRTINTLLLDNRVSILNKDKLDTLL